MRRPRRKNDGISAWTEYHRQLEQYVAWLENQRAVTKPQRVPVPPSVVRFPVIVADPPWPYEVWSSDTGQGRSAEAHYRTMTWHELHAMAPAVQRVTDDDAALFLWVTAPSIERAFSVARAWGFAVVTKAFCWVKLTQGYAPDINLGHWTRANSEDCWLCVRGDPTRVDKGVAQVIETLLRSAPEAPTIRGRPGQHSEKPEEVQDRIERLLGAAGPRLELFGRRRRAGWVVLGNELDGLDITESLRMLAEGQELPQLARPQAALWDAA